MTESYTEVDERLGALRATSRGARPARVRMRFTARRVGFEDLAGDERRKLEED